MTQENFEVKLPLFKGPFDLLLFFIERDELDIYDIPISKITNDFLSYLHHLESLNVELASEFILVAATLMRIKSKPQKKFWKKLVLKTFLQAEKSRHLKRRRSLSILNAEYKRDSVPGLRREQIF